jgi:hypothetical protein
MAIGRVAGPMLLEDLDRQGLDLQFTTSNQALVYLDFSNFRMSVNQLGSVETLGVNGNLSAGNIILDTNARITTQQSNQQLIIQPNGSGNVTIFRANVQNGWIDDAPIGQVTPRDGTFAILDSTRFTNKTGSIPFTDADGLVDSDDLKYFSANSTLVAGNIISKSATIGFGNITVSNLTVFTANVDSVAFFDASQVMKTSTGLKFFAGNNTLRSTNIKLTAPNVNHVVYLDSSNSLVTSSALSFDGTNMNATGITTLGNVRISSNQITTAGANQDLILAPAGSGKINASFRFISDLLAPVNDNDATTKKFVEDLVTAVAGSPNSINQLNSSVVVFDDDINESRIELTVDGVRVGYITSNFANIQTIAINDSTISTISGPLQLVPVNDNKIRVLTSSAMTLPAGVTTSRPLFAETGDIRYNTNLGTIEWYNGDDWKQPAEGPIGIDSQILVPNGIDTTYTLDHSNSSDGVLVSINGVVQQPSTAYSVAGDQITFAETPVTTDIIEIRFLTTTVAIFSSPIITDVPYRTLAQTPATPTLIDSFYALHYRSARYTYSSKNTASDRFETGEINLVHDGFSPYFNVRHVGNGATSIISWTASIDPFGVLNLYAASSLIGTQVKLHRMYFSDQT